MGSAGRGTIVRQIERVKILVDGRPYDNIEATLLALAYMDNEFRPGRIYCAEGYVEGRFLAEYFGEKETPVKVNQNVLDALKAKLIPCPAFESAGLIKIRPVADDDIGIPITQVRSCVWHDIHLVQDLFKSHFFDWLKLARVWRSIEELALAGENVDEMVDRINEILCFWKTCEPEDI